MEKSTDNILIAVPCFGGSLQYLCADTLIKVDRVLTEKGIAHTILFIGNDSLVPRVRSRFANIALFDTDAEGRKFTQLLFVDADLGFDARHVFTMLDAGKPIICLPYSKKTINWQSVAAAVKRGVPPEQLPHFAGTACINADRSFSVTETTPIRHTGTGAMLIQVSVLKAMADAHPEWKYKMSPDEISCRTTKETEAFDFFQIGIRRGNSYWLPEDYFFIEEARALGFETFLIPTAQTIHVGYYEYLLNMPAIATFGRP